MASDESVDELAQQVRSLTKELERERARSAKLELTVKEKTKQHGQLVRTPPRPSSPLPPPRRPREHGHGARAYGSPSVPSSPAARSNSRRSRRRSTSPTG